MEQPNPDRSPTGEERRPARTQLFLTAVLRWGPQGRAAVRVRNLSAAGAMIEGAGAIDIGSEARLERGSLAASGTVRWSDPKRLGIEFDQPIDVGAWMAPSRSAHQQRVDRVIAGSVEPVSSSPPPITLVGDLMLASQLVDVVGDVLADDPVLLLQYSQQMQCLDLLAQLLDALRRQSGGRPVAIDGLRASIRAALQPVSSPAARPTRRG